MSVYRPKGSTVYVFDFQLDGHRFCGTTGATERRAAEQVEADERRRSREKLDREAVCAGAPLTINLACDRYWIEDGQHKSNSKDLFRDLGRLVDFFGENRLLADIRDDDVAKLVAWRRGHHVQRRGERKKGAPPPPLIAPATVNRSTTEVLQRVFVRAIRIWKLHLPEAPHFTQHMLPEPVERIRELRADEDEALAGALDPDYEIVREFSLASGLRMRETLLTWSQVDLNAGVIIRLGKGGRPIRLPISSEMRDILVSRRGHHPEWVFTYTAKRTRKDAPKKPGRGPPKRVRGERRPITYQGLKTHWRRRRAAAGVENYRWHDNRHSFATNLLRATGGNFKLVQRALNHARIETTAKYAHVLDDEVRAGLEAASRTRRKKSREKSRDGSGGAA
ncbi:tyrosine-type recombinase/integrase [Xanthobacteraceae bacterium Astr-EGSB]|uniref:tyrosine-type recombinase/integrase n=1 Tax=Astrobacterium formosum TaxID=3069710 RepID=UPI0027B74289|nr:tyrosine-type recombinase/integrase [Xanthobacteraceae bacterium Astr-EGSB]